MLLEHFNKIEETVERWMDINDEYRVINNHKSQIVFQISCHCNTILELQEEVDNELPYGVSSELTFQDGEFELTIIE